MPQLPPLLAWTSIPGGRGYSPSLSGRLLPLKEKIGMGGYGGKDASDLFLVYRARELNSHFLRAWGRRWSSQASVTHTRTHKRALHKGAGSGPTVHQPCNSEGSPVSACPADS